jgi:hypothetical protein
MHACIESSVRLCGVRRVQKKMRSLGYCTQLCMYACVRVRMHVSMKKAGVIMRRLRAGLYVCMHVWQSYVVKNVCIYEKEDIIMRPDMSLYFTVSVYVFDNHVLRRTICVCQR